MLLLGAAAGVVEDVAGLLKRLRLGCDDGVADVVAVAGGVPGLLCVLVKLPNKVPEDAGFWPPLNNEGVAFPDPVPEA